MERGQIEWIVYQNTRANGYRFTVWANGKQNSGLANFVLASHHLHKSNPFSQKKVYESLQLVSKVTSMKWNTNFCLEHLKQKNITFSEILLLTEVFLIGMT